MRPLAPTLNYKWVGVQGTGDDGTPRTGRPPLARWTAARCGRVTGNGALPNSVGVASKQGPTFDWGATAGGGVAGRGAS
jgi:hypothetical protein